MKIRIRKQRRSTGTICWFSCGVTSAVATKLALSLSDLPRPIRIAYCASTLKTEHPDNHRFLDDCERWFGQKIEMLYSTEYEDIYDVFDKTRWLVGVRGARCTTELKKKVRIENSSPRWVHVFGFDASEQKRFDRFVENNPDTPFVRCPLLEQGITKADCLKILRKAGIEIPEMYKLGFKNNNCLGCVKGGAGYWNMIRIHFPGIFQKMARYERKLNAAICKTQVGGVRQRVFLDELPPDTGRYDQEPDIKCGIWCADDEIDEREDG